MDNVLQTIHRASRRAGKWFDRVINVFDSDDPLMIIPYRGYANADQIFLKGRVLENENIFEGKSESEVRNLIDSFKRFESDEWPGATVGIRLGENYFKVVTDEEGYFTLDSPWQSPPQPARNRWLSADVQLLEAPGREEEPILEEAEIYYPSRNATYGVISDIDDTVLQTHVTSRFRLKMLYATLFQDAHQRLPMEGIVDVFHAFVKGSDGKSENPIFYVSNSPHNIYDLLVEFMDVQDLPKGPIMLRDIGLPILPRPKDYRGHKIETISHILETFPELPFIMLGDTAERDADFYLTLAEEFPERIVAIYIRHTRATKNARRVARLIENNTAVDAILVKNSQEIYEHALEKGHLRS